MNDNPFFSDKIGHEEVFENDTVEEDSFAEEASYNPLRPAYLQLPLGMAEIPETEQPRRHRKLTWELRSIVSLHQKWHDVLPEEEKFLLLHQSWNAANQALVSSGLKVEFKGNS